MKTERLIDWLNSVPTWYESDGKVLDEVIKRLGGYDTLKKKTTRLQHALDSSIEILGLLGEKEKMGD